MVGSNVIEVCIFESFVIKIIEQVTISIHSFISHANIGIKVTHHLKGYGFKSRGGHWSRFRSRFSGCVLAVQKNLKGCGVKSQRDNGVLVFAARKKFLVSLGAAIL